MPGKINLGGLESGEAVLRIQAALADLLNRAESSNSNIVELGVDLGKGKVGKISTVKMKIRDAMKE
jgi:hypothetical protein